MSQNYQRTIECGKELTSQITWYIFRVNNAPYIQSPVLHQCYLL